MSLPAPNQFLPKRWLPISITVFTLMFGFVAAGFGYLGSQQISSSIQNELLITYPTLEKVYQLIHLVEDTKSCFEDVHPDITYLEAEVAYYEDRFMEITHGISDPNMYALASSIRDHFSMFIEDGLVYQRLKNNGEEGWSEAHQVSLRSEELQDQLDILREQVIGVYRMSLSRVRDNTLLFNTVFGVLSLILLLFGSAILWGMRYFLNELEKRGEELLLALEQAEEADRAKSQFMAVISHEIRTPMNGVIGMAELLQQSQLSTIQKQYVKTILQSADTQLHLLGNILDMSKLDAQSMVLEMETFQLRDVIESSVLQVSGHAEEKDLRLDWVPPDLPLQHRGDAAKISQVMTNLLNNAIKFTEEGKVTVRVSFSPSADGESDHLEVSVSDTGIGIPKEKWGSIFKRFVQADNSTTRKYGGTGLGLSICRDLCKLMGGSIAVTDSPDGGAMFTMSLNLFHEGAVRPTAMASHHRKLLVMCGEVGMSDALSAQLKFWGFEVESIVASLDTLELESGFDGIDAVLVCDDLFNAPLQRALRPLPVPLILMAPQRILSEVDVTLFPKGLHKVFYPVLTRSSMINVLQSVFEPEVWMAIEERESLNLGEVLPMDHSQARWDPKLSILLAEDNATNQLVAREMFGSLWLTIDVVQNGAEAVELFKKRSYDIIFMDLLMPVMDGYEAVEKIRQLEGMGETTPIIALTANVAQDDRMACQKVGMSEVLAKPIRLLDLEQCLERWLPAEKRRRRSAFDSPLDKDDDAAAPEIQIHAPVPPNSSQDRELDFDFDGVLKITSGKVEVAKKVVHTFIKHVNDNFSGAHGAIASGDRDELKRHVHTVKSSAAYAGAMRLSSQARELEPRCSSDEFAVLRLGIQRMEESLSHFLEAVEASTLRIS